MFAILSNVTKTVTTNYSASLENYSVTQHTIFTYSNIGINSAIFTNFNTFANICMGINNSAVTNLRTIFNNGKRLNCNISTNFSTRSNISQIADYTFNFFLRTEQFQQGSKCKARIFYTNYRSAIQFRVSRT